MVTIFDIRINLISWLVSRWSRQRKKLQINDIDKEENQNQTKLDTKSLPFSERGKKEIQRTRSSNTVNANDRGTRGSIHRRASA